MSVVYQQQIGLARQIWWVPWSRHNPEEFFDSHRNKGPGERRVAWELTRLKNQKHVVMEGSRSTYDIRGEDGSKWEVKADCRIFPGRTQKKTTDIFLVDARYAALEMRKAVTWPHETIDAEMLSVAGVDVERLLAFREEHFDKLLRGEFGKERAAEFAANLKNISCAKEFLPDSVFTHRYFLEPQAFIHDYATHAKASEVFAGVDGIVIADEQLGFAIVYPDSFDQVFLFDGISRDCPRFKVTGLKIRRRKTI